MILSMVTFVDFEDHRQAGWQACLLNSHPWASKPLSQEHVSWVPV